MTFSEICKKEVVQIESGVCLGKIDDVVFNPITAQIEQFVMLGRPKLLGILGREPPFYIHWNEIDKFGIDAILIHTTLPAETAGGNRGLLSFLKSRF